MRNLPPFPSPKNKSLIYIIPKTQQQISSTPSCTNANSIVHPNTTTNAHSSIKAFQQTLNQHTCTHITHTSLITCAAPSSTGHQRTSSIIPHPEPCSSCQTGQAPSISLPPSYPPHRPCHQYRLQHTVPSHRPSFTPPLHNNKSVQSSKSYIPNINIWYMSSFNRLQRSKIHIQQPRYSSIQLSPARHTHTISRHHPHSRPTLQAKSHPGTPAKHATSLSAGPSPQSSISGLPLPLSRHLGEAGIQSMVMTMALYLLELDPPGRRVLREG